VSIASLVRDGLLPEPPAVAPAAAAPSTALAFAFDAGYRLPFKVMLASLARAGTLTDLPIFVYSTDATLLDDPFVRAATDRFFLISGALAETLEHLARERVRRPERADWNRGTFLKWAVFQPAGVDQVLFLDADMIALGAIEPLLSRAPDAQLVGGPQFPRSLARDETGPVPAPVLAERLEGLVTGTAPLPTRLNSGVMVVRRPLLEDDVRRALVDHASRKLLVNEQSHLTSFFARRPGSLVLVESAWNFHESYLKRLPQPVAEGILAHVRILHYPGAQKPWLDLDRPARRRSLALWREVAAWAGLS
jgi:lipopolysaccharide biosynthesis glycosyltransferase